MNKKFKMTFTLNVSKDGKLVVSSGEKAYEYALIDVADPGAEYNGIHLSKLLQAELLMKHYAVAMGTHGYLVVNCNNDENFIESIQDIAASYQGSVRCMSECASTIKPDEFERLRAAENIHPLTRKTMSEAVRRFKEERKSLVLLHENETETTILQSFNNLKINITV